MEELDKISQKLPNQEFDYYKIVKILLSRWYWIAGSVIICYLVSNVYIRYTPKTYATSAIMKFEEKKSAISDLVGIPGATDRNSMSRAQSETIVLTSSPLLLEAVKRLDYRFSFYTLGRGFGRTVDIYPEKKLDIQLVKFDSLNFFHDLVTFKSIDKTSFSVSYKEGGRDIKKIYNYGILFTIGPTSLIIKHNEGIPASILFKLNAPEEFVGRISGGLKTTETAKNSNLLALTLTDANAQFAADALNAVMDEYLIYDAAQRKQSATQMIKYINGGLDTLINSVKTSENKIEQYKQDKKIMDVGSATELAMGKSKELESQISALTIELITLNQLKKEVDEARYNININFTVASENIDPQLSGFISKLNDELNVKNVLSIQYKPGSPQINNVTQQILQIKTNASNSIERSRQLIETKINYLQNQLIPVKEQIATLPTEEGYLTGLKRDFDIKDKVLSILSEKRLDQQIASAGVLPGAIIVDRARANNTPITPVVSAINRNAIILGIVIGLGLVVLIRILNPYIYDKETVESLTTIPIIGVIRKYPEEIDEFSTQILAISRPKSLFAESVRSVRTNLNFLASEKKSKVICITSEVAGEGKSFVAVNLSSTLSLIDKKVILVAADLRRSKLHKTFHVPNDLGLSNYLANQCTSDDIINHSNQSGLDFIISGPVPPNPSELLHSDRMTELIADLSARYDVIMVDTAPIGLVSDAIPLIRTSDINLFVLRCGKSKFYAATIPQRVAQEYNLNNTVIVLNAYSQDLLHSRFYSSKFTGDSSGKSYYYSDYTGYESSGYYVDEEENKWWKNIIRWIKK